MLWLVHKMPTPRLTCLNILTQLMVMFWEVELLETGA